MYQGIYSIIKEEEQGEDEDVDEDDNNGGEDYDDEYEDGGSSVFRCTWSPANSPGNVAYFGA